MNAIIAHPDFAAIAPKDGPGSRAEHDPVFSPERQADFLASLQLGGNVRAASHSPRPPIPRRSIP